VIQRTLGIIKPDAVAAGHAGEILTTIHAEGFRVVAMRMVKLDRRQAEGFYGVHRGKPFFDGLVSFMTEGPIIVLALEREDAIRKWREVMGATNPANAAEGTVRKRFGTSIERNAVHGSDAPETAQFELGFMFAGMDLV
jgi:nucleoside-diphosphate kinase